MSEKKHDCGVLIEKFETLVRAHERGVVGGSSPLSSNKVWELDSLRKELTTLMSLACANDFGYAAKED